jgi:hypothetical protein
LNLKIGFFLVHILKGRHALYCPPVDASQRQGATLVATCPKIGIDIYKIGDHYHTQDLETLLALRPYLISLSESPVHSLLDSTIAKLPSGKGAHCVYLALDQRQQLQGVLLGQRNTKTLRLEDLVSFQTGVGGSLLASFLVAEGKPSTVEVAKASDQWYSKVFLNNGWIDLKPLKGFYEHVGFQQVTEGYAKLKEDYSRLSSWVESKKRVIKFFKRPNPQALLIAGLGDGNTRTP